MSVRRRSADNDPVNLSTIVCNSYDARDLEYLKRCGMKPEDVQRPPRSGDWHGFLPEEVPEANVA
jgi:hypothetical protein